jgi:hypothetical protein
MTREEARKLLGGYATGSLTEAERSALFEAALDDQELFDELSGEQVLKEVLDEPGARQRLIAALEPPRHRAWLWITAAAALASVIGVVVLNRTPPPQQVAQVLKSPEQVARPAPAPAPPPAPVPAVRKVAPLPEPAAPPPAAAETQAEAKTEAKTEVPAEPLADQLQTRERPQAKRQSVGVGGGRGGASPAAAALRAENAAAKAAAGFAFSYAVGADGYLEIVPTAPGLLSVTANSVVIFPGGVVSAGMPIRIAIPAGANSLVITFSATRGIAGSPVRRDEASGTVTDQDPPNGRIAIELFLTPATR